MGAIETDQANLMNVLREQAGGRKIVLNVGSGVKRESRLDPRYREKSQWHEVRLDMDEKSAPDILGDLSDLSMLPDGAVAAVHSAHNLEHLEAHQVMPALQGFYRVLVFGGELLVHCPDLQTIAAFIAEGKLEQPLYTAPGGDVTPLDIVYGLSTSIAKGSPLMAHRTGFTAQTLGHKLSEAGFCNITITRDRFDLMALARKLPAHHAQRRNTPEILLGERYNPREAVAVTVNNLQHLPHPGLMRRNAMADELDIPPAAL